MKGHEGEEMKRLMPGLAVSLIAALNAPPLAYAQPDSCGGSTVEESACAMTDAKKADAAMHTSYGRAIGAAKAMLESELRDPSTPIHHDFRGDIEDDQRRWLSWAEHECRLEGDFTMGSVGAVVEPECRERLAIDRAKMLDNLAMQLEDLTPSTTPRK